MSEGPDQRENLPTPADVGAVLRRIRIEAGLTQKQLACRLGQSIGWVRRRERGTARTDPVELIAWCRACGVSAKKAFRQIADFDESADG